MHKDMHEDVRLVVMVYRRLLLFVAVALLMSKLNAKVRDLALGVFPARRVQPLRARVCRERQGLQRHAGAAGARAMLRCDTARPPSHVSHDQQAR
jgi:hypothetical protein